MNEHTDYDMIINKLDKLVNNFTGIKTDNVSNNYKPSLNNFIKNKKIICIVLGFLVLLVSWFFLKKKYSNNKKKLDKVKCGCLVTIIFLLIIYFILKYKKYI